MDVYAIPVHCYDGRALQALRAGFWRRLDATFLITNKAYLTKAIGTFCLHIPPEKLPSRMTSGERRVAQRLEDNLAPTTC